MLLFSYLIPFKLVFADEISNGNMDRQSGSWVIDQNNILHILISITQEH